MLTPTEEIQIALVERLNDDSELFAHIPKEGMHYPLNAIQVSYRRDKPEWDEVGRGRIMVDILLKEMEFSLCLLGIILKLHSTAISIRFIVPNLPH